VQSRELQDLRQDHLVGCGHHITQVKAGVPARTWCPGHPNAAREGGGMFGRLFGRS
jgi:hypothetical protein